MEAAAACFLHDGTIGGVTVKAHLTRVTGSITILADWYY